MSALIAAVIIIFVGTATAAAELPEPMSANTSVKAPELAADSALLVELSRGQILHSKKPEERFNVPIACKIMTAILTIEKSKLDANVTISSQSAEMDNSSLKLEAGEKYSVADLLYLMILSSSDGAAYALSEYIGGDVKSFVDLMNSKAQQLNMKDTRFSNPSGMNEKSQYTTANDISLLLKYALQNQVFKAIFSVKAQPVTKGNTTEVLVSQNKLFWTYNSTTSGEICYNSKTHQSLAAVALKNDMRLLAIVINSPEDNIYTDATSLFDYGFNNFKRGTLVSKGQLLKTLSVSDKEIRLVCTDDVYYTYPIGMNYIKDIRFNINQPLKLPIKKDQIIGTVSYTLQDNSVINVNLYSDADVIQTESAFSKITNKLTESRDLLYLLVILIFVEFALIITKLAKAIKKRISGK